MSDVSRHVSPTGIDAAPPAANSGRVRRRVPPNFFSIPLGIAGLADAWAAAVPTLGSPAAIAHVLDIVAGVVWMVILVAYAAQGPRRILRDLRDQVLAPFVALAPITAMLLASQLGGYALSAAKVLVVVFLIVTVIIGGWLTGQWMLGEIEQDAMHPGYFLPTVAGGFIGAFSAASVDLRDLAEASFGIGALCWVLLGSIVLNRLFTRKLLPAALLPTMAIELAPPAVGGIAYAAIHPAFADPLGYALAGYAVLMALVQIRLLPRYARLNSQLLGLHLLLRGRRDRRARVDRSEAPGRLCSACRHRDSPHLRLHPRDRAPHGSRRQSGAAVTWTRATSVRGCAATVGACYLIGAVRAQRSPTLAMGARRKAHSADRDTAGVRCPSP
jgi:tellurite resistance protein